MYFIFFNHLLHVSAQLVHYQGASGNRTRSI